jgi:hypothetical protein
MKPFSKNPKHKKNNQLLTLTEPILDMLISLGLL